ncbi:hypothetical protein B0H34DRAFT_796326 [Crassisporium funariophilum]|nr:hypothetical protein B0H34DRAFT_796326 [Crassisporium funariophilum]
MNVHFFTSLLIFATLAWSQPPTLAPPSTFPTLSSTSSGSSTTQSSNSTGTPPTPTNSAQFPSLSGVTSCVSNCLAVGAARVNCTSVVDVNCYCVNPQYPAELVACVLATCPSEVITAENLAQQFCNLAVAKPTLTFASVPVSPTSSPPQSLTVSTPTSPTTTPTSTSTGAAWTVADVSQGTLIGLGMSVFGIILGTHYVR